MSEKIINTFLSIFEGIVCVELKAWPLNDRRRSEISTEYVIGKK